MISAKIIADSIANNVRLTTMELNYPRFIHSEFMTHRMFSRNASSSRAIPIEKMIASTEASPAVPIHWGKNQPGMQAGEEIKYIATAKYRWTLAAEQAIIYAAKLNSMKLHKQVVNRLLEPFQYIKVIVTATEWDNFFRLRLHRDAQPEIVALASSMKKAMDDNIPRKLDKDEPLSWHLPYISMVDLEFWAVGELSTLDLIKCSVARCARVSYLNHDASEPIIEKDLELASKLLKDGHMSPFEHQATPMRQDSFNVHAEEGITHIDKYDNLWSGNFRGWLQYRQMI